MEFHNPTNINEEKEGVELELPKINASKSNQELENLEQQNKNLIDSKITTIKERIIKLKQIFNKLNEYLPDIVHYYTHLLNSNNLFLHLC